MQGCQEQAVQQKTSTQGIPDREGSENDEVCNSAVSVGVAVVVDTKNVKVMLLTFKQFTVKLSRRDICS